MTRGIPLQQSKLWNCWSALDFYATIAERFAKSRIKSRCVGDNGRWTG